jgi:hypothetical protein
VGSYFFGFLHLITRLIVVGQAGGTVVEVFAIESGGLFVDAKTFLLDVIHVDLGTIEE